MTDPGHHDARRPGRAPRAGRRAAGRVVFAVAALVLLFSGAAATGPEAAARQRDDAARNERPRDEGPSDERRDATATRRPIERGAGPRGAADGAADRAEIPVEIAIPEIGVEARVEVRSILGNRMQDPTGPDVVAWYDDTDDLGSSGNAVFAGHLDFTDVGPAVFAELNELARNDRVLVTDDDGDVHAYRVVSRRVVSAAAGPWEELTASTDRPTLTLITCAGPWDDALGHYRDRLVVRAVRVGS